MAGLIDRWEQTLARARYVLIRRGCPPDWAEDLADEALLKCWLVERRGEREINDQYVYQTAYHLLVDTLRRRARAEGLIRESLEMLAEEGWQDRDPSAEAAIGELELNEAAREQAARLYRALRLLSERQRQVLVWRSEGTPHAEIGRRLGVSEDASKKLMHRAVYHARAHLRTMDASPVLAAGIIPARERQARAWRRLEELLGGA